MSVGFTTEDQAKIQAIQEAEGLPSKGAAVRHAVRFTFENLEPDPD